MRTAMKIAVPDSGFPAPVFPYWGSTDVRVRARLANQIARTAYNIITEVRLGTLGGHYLYFSGHPLSNLI